MLSLETVSSDGHPMIDEARSLFREYQQSLNLDLGFQRFEDELRALPGAYAPPSGRLLVARWNGASIGCGGVRPFGEDVCEMKRLYVRQAYRGRGAGEEIANALIGAAEAMGYRRMRLDTLARLHSAIKLYERLGFVQIPAYHDAVTVEPLIYLEKILDTPRSDHAK